MSVLSMERAPMAQSAVELSKSVAVSCVGVTKTYGVGSAAVQALRGIDLTIYGGELTMLVGPSGCGKTTLISVIAGILDHDGGQCLVYGQDFLKMRQGQRTRFRGLNIGFVFQAFNLIPTLTIEENVSIPLLIQGKPTSVANKAAGEMLERVGLADKRRKLPRELSGGQQQRVAIARALVHHPRLLVCDEPTSALDAENGQKIMSLLREVALAEGRCLIVVTHDSRIFKYADRIAQCEDGRVRRVFDSVHDYIEANKDEVH